MANNNPQYNAWLFRRAGPTPKLQDAAPDAPELDDTDTKPDFHRTMEHRRRVEIFAEARLLKAQLNDLW